ncbi:MAG: ATP-binding protein [Candidatus Margulisiibacteriota bacterium]
MQIENPFRPGAGHPPPFLAGRTAEQDEMRKLLRQTVITENLVLTGLRGVGKTVLLETFKPIAYENHWLWAGNDLSETASITEQNLATRILTDIALVTSAIITSEVKVSKMGFATQEETVSHPINYEVLRYRFDSTPGLVSDKLKATLEWVWPMLPHDKLKGIVFAYDEAQNLSDHAAKDEYPLSLLLEVFQSLQRKKIPYLLILTGLPTLFPKLVEARTYAERMFHIIFLKQLSDKDSEDAINIPIQKEKSLLTFSQDAVRIIVSLSGGYPYFIQFICKEVFDIWIPKLEQGEIPGTFLPSDDILRKLDTDFFQGRWAKATDRQRDLLTLVSTLPNCEDEFTVQEIASASKNTQKPFSSSHIIQMLASLADAGLVYKNRHGKYALAVPLLSRFIRRSE